MSVHSFARPQVDKPSIGAPRAAAYPVRRNRNRRRRMCKINQEKKDRERERVGERVSLPEIIAPPERQDVSSFPCRVC